MSQKGGKSQHQGQKRPNLPFANEPRAAGKSTDGKKVSNREYSFSCHFK